MPRKQPFPPEPDTQPDLRPGGRRVSGAAPKNKRARAEATTVPPPLTGKKGKPTENRSSGVRSREERARKADAPGASVDEVTADLSRDPRRERDD